MNTLIINTANDSLEIVLQRENKVFHEILTSKSHHNETMLPAIDKILTEHALEIQSINQLGVVVGPGSFTGIRVGIATVKAFRDSLGIVAKGINNLDYLFALAKAQNNNCDTVAILGSRNSYFVATVVNDQLYKYERNLTMEELQKVAGNSPIGMFKKDENLNSFEVELNAEILLNCLNGSDDKTLVPVYYQLSQAESEKIKRANLQIREAEVQDLIAVAKLENETSLPNKMSQADFENSILNKNHKLFVTTLNEEVVGFVSVELSDEVNIENVVVAKSYRNYGIATSMLNFVVDFAKENNIDCVSLEVSKNNITAYLLYKKFGFEKRRVRKKYYADGSDAFEMCLKILK